MGVNCEIAKTTAKCPLLFICFDWEIVYDML